MRPRSRSSAKISSQTLWLSWTGWVPITAADHMPARIGPPPRPFAAVSIQVASIAQVRLASSLASERSKVPPLFVFLRMSSRGSARGECLILFLSSGCARGGSEVHTNRAELAPQAPPNPPDHGKP